MSEFDPIADALLNDKPIPTNSDTPPADVVQPQTSTEPADSTPPATPPVATTPPQQTSEPNTDWISNVAKIAGEEIKSEEDLKNLIQRAKSNENLESQLEAIRLENEALKGTQPKFANERIEKLNELYSKGATQDQIKAFETINSVGELKEIKPIDAVKLALQLRDGLTAEEADIRIKNSYKLDETIYDASDVVASNIDLKLDSKKDLEFLEQYKAKVSEAPQPKPDNSEEEFRQKIAETLQKVTPIANSIAEKFTAIKGVNVNGAKDDQALLLDLPVSEESRAAVSKLVADYAAINDVPLTPEGIAGLEDYAKKVLILNNFDSMVIHINSMAEERLRKEFNNPASISRGVTPPNNQGNDAEARLEQFILES